MFVGPLDDGVAQEGGYPDPGREAPELSEVLATLEA